MISKIINIIRFSSYIPFLFIIFLISFYIKLLRILDFRNYSKVWEETLQKYVDSSIGKKIYINKNKFIKFYCPNTITSFRSKSFFLKEPETIQWMNKFGGNKKVFYDIGSNVGLYSIYYSKKFNSSTFSFEPSFKNLEILSRNIQLNSLSKLITIIPNAVSSKNKVSKFYQLNFTQGFSGATFDNKKVEKQMMNFLKKEFNPIEYFTLGINLDYLIKSKIFPKPDLIKIDVDGAELDVILAIKKILNKKRKLSLLIEIDNRIKKNIKVHKLIKSLGFKLQSTKGSNYIYNK